MQFFKIYLNCKKKKKTRTGVLSLNDLTQAKLGKTCYIAFKSRNVHSAAIKFLFHFWAMKVRGNTLCIFVYVIGGWFYEMNDSLWDDSQIVSASWEDYDKSGARERKQCHKPALWRFKMQVRAKSCCFQVPSAARWHETAACECFMYLESSGPSADRAAVESVAPGISPLLLHVCWGSWTLSNHIVWSHAQVVQTRAWPQRLLVGKVKVKTTGSKREDVWLSSESIAFPLLPPFDAVEPWRRPSQVQHDWSSCGAT